MSHIYVRLQALRDQLRGAVDYETAEDAVIQIGQLDDPAAARALIGLLDQHGHIDIARDAEEALVRMGRLAVPELLAALRSPGDPHTRMAVATCLGLIGDRRALVPLVEVFEGPDDLVRPAAAIALGRLGDPRSIPVLLDLLDAEGVQTRKDAAEALARAQA